VARLSCAPFGPLFTIKAVVFAEYGRPVGQCPAHVTPGPATSTATASAFTPSECASINSLLVVQAACLERTDCHVPVQPSTFSFFRTSAEGYQVQYVSTGNNCQGSQNDDGRWLFVQATCEMPAPSAPATEAFFYAAARGADDASTVAAVLQCPVAGMVIASVDAIGYGELRGAFVNPGGASSAQLVALVSRNFSSVFGGYWSGQCAACGCAFPAATAGATR
jgi:hypothetical protein